MDINMPMTIRLLSVLFGFMSELTLSESCSFPSFMSKARKPWIRKAVTPTGLVLNKTYIFYHEWDFQQEGLISVAEVHPQRTHESTQVAVKTYTCVHEFPDSMFMVIDSTLGSETKTLCVKFVKRSFYVVQLAFGTEYQSYKHGDLDCNAEILILDPLILLYYHENILSEVPLEDFIEPCPLHGGFNVEIYQEDGGVFCDSYPPIRLENDCTPGAGMVFRSFMNECALGESLTQKFFCIASWKEENYQFMIARPQYYFTWQTAVIVIRLQTSTSIGKYKAVVSSDLLCNTATPGDYQESFFEAVLSRFIIQDPCADSANKCTLVDPRQCSRHQQETCPSTCSFCSVHRVWESFTLPQPYQGRWLRQTYEGGKETIHINEGVIQIPSFGHVNLMGKSECVRNWIRKDMNDYLGIMSFKNGCSPKLVGVMLSKESTSVLNMRISQPTSIPVNPFGYDFLFLWPYWCNHVEYGLDVDNPSLRDRYWTAEDGWSNLVAVGSRETNASPCNLPARLHHAKIIITERPQQDQYSCDSQIHFQTNYSFIINRNLCRFDDNSSFVARSQHYTCLSSFLDKHHNKYLILRVGSYQGIATNFQCWLFSAVNDTYTGAVGKVLVFPAGNCDPVALTRADHLPLAEIVHQETLPPPTTLPPTAVKSYNISNKAFINNYSVYIIIGLILITINRGL